MEVGVRQTDSRFYVYGYSEVGFDLRAEKWVRQLFGAWLTLWDS
jgi:hypothetical protein